MKTTPPLRWLAGMILLPLLLLAASPKVSAQLENHLILKKRGYIDKMHFLVGDPITFFRNGADYREEYIIQGIGTSYIVVSGEELPIDSIREVIRLRTGFNFRASGAALLAAGPGYLVIGAVNALFRGTTLVPPVSSLIVAGTLVASGLLLPMLQEQDFHMGRRYRLVIVQSDPRFNRPDPKKKP